MNKRTIAIIVELIPVISAPLYYFLIVSKADSRFVKVVIAVAMLLAFLGFAAYLIGRKLAKDDRTVKILGILDLLATLSVPAVYVLALISIAL